jgi:hypothetical protein
MLTDNSEQVADGVIDHYCPGVAECHAKLTMDELKLLLFPDAYTRLFHASKLFAQLVVMYGAVFVDWRG